MRRVPAGAIGVARTSSALARALSATARALSEAPRAASATALGTLLALGCLPVVWLIASGLAGPGRAGVAAFDDTRAVLLLLRSLGIAAGAALLALVLGGVPGVMLARARVPGRPALLVALFAAFCISPYVLALGWLGGRLDSSAGRLFLGHPSAVAWVLGASFAPLAALATYHGVRRLPLAAEEAAFLCAGPRRALTGVVWRGMVPIAAAVGLLVFALAFSDYAVGSLLQVPTYPIEVFLFYAGHFDPGAAARACLPLIAVGAAVAALTAFYLPRTWLRRGVATAGTGWPLAGAGRRLGLVVALLGIALPLAPPLARLSASLPEVAAVRRALASGLPATGNSIVIAVLAAGFAVALALAAAPLLAGLTRGWLVVAAALLLLPVFVPASAFGIAWVEMNARLGQPLAWLGAGAPALCLAARLGGAAALLLAGVRSALPQEPLDAAALQEGRAWRRWLWIELPWVAPAAAGVGAALFALCLNDAGVLVLTVPPGRDVLPLWVDNMLHYGLPREAVALALFTALAAALPALVTLLLAFRWYGRQR